MSKRKTRNQHPNYVDSESEDCNIEYNNEKLKKGHLYIIYDKNSKKIYKIGITGKNDNSLLSRYSVYYSNPLCIQFYEDICNYDKAEHFIHNILQNFRINTSELFQNINFFVVKLVVDSVVYIFNRNSDLVQDFKIKMTSKRKKIKMDIDIDFTEDKKLIKSVNVDTEQKLPKILCDIILQNICEKIELNYNIFNNITITDAIVKINDMYNDTKLNKLREKVPNFDNKLENIKQLKKKLDSELESYQTILATSGKGFHPNDIEPDVLSDLLLSE